jgi:hypothetical protein
MNTSSVTTSTEQITSTKTSGVMPTSSMVDRVMDHSISISMPEMAMMSSIRVRIGTTEKFTAKRATIPSTLERMPSLKTGSMVEQAMTHG